MHIKKRRRRCKHCQSLYEPDCRNLRHQKYCSKKECKKASKKQSQKQWLNKPENKNYFRSQDDIHGVQNSRKTHPGYSKPKSSTAEKVPAGADGDTLQVLVEGTLQEDLPLQTIDNYNEIEKYSDFDQNRLKNQPLQDLLSEQTVDISGLEGDIKKTSLQELLMAQSPVLLGLIANLTGTALQEDIANTTRRFTLIGKDILNNATPIRGG